MTASIAVLDSGAHVLVAAGDSAAVPPFAVVPDPDALAAGQEILQRSLEALLSPPTTDTA